MSLVKHLQSIGFDSSSLDGVVHTAASNLAAGINNAGLKEQKLFLSESGDEADYSEVDSADDLDDAVCSMASSLASDANNGGIKSQIEFLQDKCDYSDDDIDTVISAFKNSMSQDY